MTPPCLIAVDPGSKVSAFVTVAPTGRGRIRVIRTEMVDGTCEAMAAFLDASINRYENPAVIAIEWASGFAFQACRVPPLLASQGVAGELSGLAFERRIPILKVPATRWRAAVVGKMPRAVKIPGVKTPKPKYDDLIARALPTFVQGLDGSNVHVRDALGLAVYAAREVWKWAA